MLNERLEARWITAFIRVFELCRVAPGEACAIVSETQSRPVNVQLAELALLRLGARPFHVQLVSPVPEGPVAAHTAGASRALQSLGPVLQALSSSGFVVDCTVDGLTHAPELATILKGGARVLTIPDEHPEALERLVPDPALEAPVRAGMRMLKRSRRLMVTSDAGTQLVVSLDGALVAGGWGFAARPGTVAQWPGGLCLCYPATGCVNGVLVLSPGDVNLTYRRYLESRVTLLVQNDYVVDIKGTGMDANLIRGYFAAWGDREAYAVSHVGWGMNAAARWDSMAMYDKRDFNGTELRSFSGCFLYSTGANELAGRRTAGRLELPMRSCTVALDDHVVVEQGVLKPEAFVE